MKIENIIVSNENISNLSATISFDIVEIIENVDILLKINEDEYLTIFTNQGNETMTYNITNLRRGINNLTLKLVSPTEEYISNPIQVLLKEAPSIENLECSYSDSTGKYILNFAFNGDVNFKYNIYLKLDINDYIEVLSNQISGDKTIEQTSTMGEHTCILKVSDGYNDYTFSPFQFEIANHKPILSKVLVTDITNNGEAYIYYSTKDIESSTLTHKLAIGTTETVITPTQVDNFYSYKVTGLSEGVSNCMISISDGIDTVSSDIFSIEVFSNTTDKKELLRRAKVRYDSAYQQLRDIIVSVVSDLKYDYDIENALIAKAQDNYKIEYSNFNKISQQSIDAIGSNKVDITKQELQSTINDVDNAVNSLETTMWGVFQDGILDQTEKDTLSNSLDLVAKEKIDIDKDYEALYNNEDLLDPAKTKLQTNYNAFIEAHNSLATTINNIINKEGIIDNTDKANIDMAFENWRTALGNYRTASLEAIDSIAKKKADDSADVVDKKWAEIILDPETGIQMQVGNLTNKVNNVTTKVDDSVKDVQVMYYLSTSETVLEGGEWSDVAPQWEKDKYMWSKTVVTLTNGTVNESDPTCIAGAKGESTYTWIKYADDENGTNMSNDPTDKSYIGFAYNKTTPIESDDASEYMWSLIKGRDGIDGKDGTSITILGSYDTVEELNNAHPDGNNNGDGYIIRGDLYIWQGTEFINVGQIKGEDGIDGKTPYMHIKYSNDGGLTFTPNNGEEAGDYIGLYTDFIEADSTNVAKYTWTKIKGYDGVNAVTYYTWIKYSDNADGTDLYDVPNENTKYIGIAVNQTIQTESTDKTKYVWSKFRGEDGVDGIDGVPGTNGIDGITYYTWIKYADDSNGNGMSDNPTNKDYIGFAYNKTTAAESTNPTDYKWSLIKGTDGVDGTNGVDGVTYYTWIKYSDNADGTGLYDIPNSNTKYIGIATNKPTATESTNKNDYIWSLFKGEDGISGTDGIGVNNIVEEYYLSTSKETQEGGEWVETPPTWEVGKYMWTRSRIEYSNGTVEYTTPICDSSWEAANDVTTELQEIDKRIAKIEVDSDSITSTVSHLTNKVDNLQIGGRNLVINSDVLNSQFSPIGDYKGTRTVVNDTNAKSKKHLEFKCTTAGTGFHTNIFSKTSDKVGKTYTWSFWAKCSVAKSGTIGHECGGQKTINLTTEWQKFTHTWKFTDAQYSSFTWYLNWNVDEILYIKDFKIEEGNKATDWTSAPEDIQNQIDENKTEVNTRMSEVEQTVDSWGVKITENSNEISSLKLTNEDFEVKIGNKADSNNIISVINASTENITISSSKVNISGFVTFSDLRNPNSYTTIHGSNIATKTISASDISTGTLTGCLLQTYADSTSKGVRIAKESLSLNGTNFFYYSNDEFRIVSDQRFSVASVNDIYLMPGLNGNTGQTSGTGAVVIPDSTLRTQKLYVVNESNFTGKVTFNTDAKLNGGLNCTGGISVGSNMSVDGTAWISTLSVTNSSTLKGVSCTSISATGTVKTTGALQGGGISTSGNMSVDGTAWIKTLYVNGNYVTSDKTLKTDIKYVNIDNQELTEDGLMSPNVNITTSDMHKFIETLPMISYRLIEDVEKGEDNTYYGFLAQEILYTKVGSELIKIPNDTEKELIGDKLRYSESKFIAFICGALQEEIKQRKALEERVKMLEDK